MNPTVEKELARLRMRLAQTPLPRFFSWWGTQLLACLPPRVRAFLADGPGALLLGREGDELVVWREQAGHIRECARMEAGQPGQAQQAIERLHQQIADPGLRNVYMVAPGQVLVRTLALPMAAEENLNQVLAFEMDRQTPFKADQVAFDARVLERDPDRRQLKVELILIRRGELDAQLKALPSAVELDAVDSWLDAPGGRRRCGNLLPPERRARRRNLRLPLNLGLGAAALVLVAINMGQFLANRAAAVEGMRAEVELARAQARDVAELRKSLSDSVAGANFLTDRKRREPLAVALLDDLTRRLPLDTYLERLQIDRNQVQIQGQAAEAARLVSLLGESACLQNPGFQGQVQPDPRTGKERFQINAQLRECHPADAAAAPATDDGGEGTDAQA